LVAALVALGLWCALVITLFGSAMIMARSDLTLMGSLLIPAVLTTLAGIFIYRHTSKRRKLQALITVVVTLLFTGSAYLAASTMFASRLYVPPTSEARHAK
jgi:hypothetical protein